jgi:hypothetical protein
MDRALVLDLLTIGTDALLGVIVAMTLFGSTENRWAVLLGAVGAILPDPCSRARSTTLRTVADLQRFHHRVHAKLKIAAFPFGVASQLMLAAVVIYLSKAANVLEIISAGKMVDAPSRVATGIGWQ